MVRIRVDVRFRLRPSYLWGTLLRLRDVLRSSEPGVRFPSSWFCPASPSSPVSLTTLSPRRRMAPSLDLSTIDTGEGAKNIMRR